MQLLVGDELDEEPDADWPQYDPQYDYDGPSVYDDVYNLIGDRPEYRQPAAKRGDAFDSLFTQGSGSGSASMVGVAVAAALCAFTVFFVAGFVTYRRRRGSVKVGESTTTGSGGPKHFVLPQHVKPVVSYKTAAGPAGLKNSPSPIQSPETADHSRHPPQLGASLSRSATPNLEMSPIDDQGRAATPSMETVESGPAGVAERSESQTWQCKGAVHLSLRYIADKEALVVSVVNAKNLQPPASMKQSPKSAETTTAEVHTIDPYVKLQLLPEKQHKAKTRVVRNTCEPVYDEEFTFYGLTAAQLQSSTLHLAVVAFDRYSRDEIIGEAICALHELEDELKIKNNTVPVEMELYSRASKYKADDNRGELLVSLCHQPAAGTVTAVVLKAKHLPKFDVSGMADPYVKVHMMYNGQRLAKKKTHVKKRTLQPVYNESFVFDLPPNDPNAMQQVSFEFTVMDWDRVTKNEVMGRCAVGASARTDAGRKHWHEVGAVMRQTCVRQSFVDVDE